MNIGTDNVSTLSQKKSVESRDIRIPVERALNRLLAKLNRDGPSMKTRRILGTSAVITKDILPLLVAATKEAPQVVGKIIKLLSNLTSPIEVLVPYAYSTTEEGQQVVFELEASLQRIKAEFANFRNINAVVDYLKTFLKKGEKLLPQECEGLLEGLLLLRNVLHIPHKDTQIQNRILWNLFSNNLDKILLHLMTCEQQEKWVVTLVQLLALIYKDQHVANLQKLLNLWLENSMSESSDNESNTERSCKSSSSPMMTSDPTSDSSDNGGRSMNGDQDEYSHTRYDCTRLDGDADINSSPGSSSLISTACNNNNDTVPVGKSIPEVTVVKKETSFRHPYPLSHPHHSKYYTKSKSKNKIKASAAIVRERMSDADSGISSMTSQFSNDNAQINATTTDDSSETAFQRPCTVIPNQEKAYKPGGNSTSSNEDDVQRESPFKSPILIKRERHSSGKTSQKLRNPPLITITAQDKQEMKKKRLHKRSKRIRKIIKTFVQQNYNPTDEDVAHVIKEFTVDFLLKGYGPLVSNLQTLLSGNSSVEMDKSHFLWLLTYFLKFAAQLEVDLKHISPVLSYEMISYLTYEGVAMCENLSLCKGDLKPHLRRMHLVVAALREFVQAVEIYSQKASSSKGDKDLIIKLRNDILNGEEFRHVFLVLIRHFKPGVQSKQYLQDLVSTNHVFLLFLEKVSKSGDYNGNFKMTEFIKEFAAPAIMQQYGHLLEDFANNGQFINDCIFTMMHHIAGDLTCPESLFQPLILKTFSKIYEVEFEIRDDWADLIEYVIHRFMKVSDDEKTKIFKSGSNNGSDETNWSKEDCDRLYWFYSKFSSFSDPIAKILEAYGDNLMGKTRRSVLNQLLHQRIIGYNQFLLFLAAEKIDTEDQNDSSSNTGSSKSNSEDKSRTSILLEQLRATNKNYSFLGFNVDNGGISPSCNYLLSTKNIEPLDISVSDVVNGIVAESHDLHWIQQQVLEVCFVKLTLEQEQNSVKYMDTDSVQARKPKLLGDFKMEPIPYQYCRLGQSVPIIPWKSSQGSFLTSSSCLLLLHKLGFHLPQDVAKTFPRIPHFWTVDVLFNVAKKLGPLPSTLKFDPSLIDTDEMDLSCDIKPPLNITSLEISIAEETPQYAMPGAGMGVGMINSFTHGFSSYNYSAAAQSVNWMTLVHKSKQLIERHSEVVISASTLISTSCSSFTDSDSEHMDDCASLKALPPTDHSEDVTMMSAESGQEDNDGGDEAENDGIA